MPVRRCANGKWRIGNGQCVYDTEEEAQRAYRGYLAQQKLDRIGRGGRRVS